MSISPLKLILIQGSKKLMIEFIYNHPEFIDEAFSLALKDDQPFSWRSAWLLSDCLEKNDVRLNDYIIPILKVIQEKESGHQRELLKLLQLAELNDETIGLVFDISVKFWSDIKNKPSLRFTALRTMVQIAKTVEELKIEIHFLLDEYYLKTLSPGIRNAALKIKKGIKVKRY